jgi:hypothetical protein
MGKLLDTLNVPSSTAAAPRVDPIRPLDQPKAGIATDALTEIARALARQAAREAFSASTEQHDDKDETQSARPHAARS